MNVHGVRRHGAIDQPGIFSAQAHIDAVQAAGFLQRGEQPDARVFVIDEIDLRNAAPKHVLPGITQGIEERFVNVQHPLISRAAQQNRHRRQAKRCGETLLGAGPVGDIVHDQHQ
ncbi:hypothetical protein D3C86_1367760 [compost metagenome]